MTNSALPSNYWVEVIHTAFKYDYSATWLYYTPGSAIWFWTGTTKVYSDHKEAVSDLLHEQCNNIQCIDYFKDLYQAGINAGLNSIQFTDHDDMTCGSGTQPLALEIVDFAGPGTEPCGGSSGVVRFRAGWEASSTCTCSASQTALNCQGFGANR